MTFAAELAKDLEAVIDSGELSVSVTYTVKGGAGKAINAYAGPASTDSTMDDQGETKIRRRQLVILTDETKGIASPGIEDTVELGGELWRVESIEREGNGKALLNLITGAVQAKHAETHKRKFGD